MNIVSCQLYWKDENKEKEDSNGTFLNYVKWLPQMLSRENSWATCGSTLSEKEEIYWGHYRDWRSVCLQLGLTDLKVNNFFFLLQVFS